MIGAMQKNWGLNVSTEKFDNAECDFQLHTFYDTTSCELNDHTSMLKASKRVSTRTEIYVNKILVFIAYSEIEAQHTNVGLTC